MGFFDGILNFKKQLEHIEAAVSNTQSSFYEVYERNVELEAEIALRTKELALANKQMLTLQHIWDMMNSSKPLSSVLNAIVNSLQGELGYLYSIIVKQKNYGKDTYIQIAASSKSEIGSNSNVKFSDYFNYDFYDYKIKFPDISELKTFIQDKQIYQSCDIEKLAVALMPDINVEKLQEFLKISKMKSYILIPLQSKDMHFGSLIVFSSRETISENETTFLKLFAKQIELAITIADLFQAVKEQAITDAMTGLYNRRYFEDCLRKEVVRSNRQNQKFTVIGVDLDYLKTINDKYGHNYGDIAIKTIADILKGNARAVDIVARMGGEEFNLILPGVDSKGGSIAAERIRKAIESVELDKIGHITASLGVATYLEHSEDIDELLELTDQAMYESKRNGRNRVTIAKIASEASWQDIAVNTFVDILSKHRIPVDENTAEMLSESLKEINSNKLYNVADLLVKTYNPEHKEGSIKQKVQIASLLARRFDMTKEGIDKLKIAILLYDIGNTMLPKELLNKREPLTEKEMQSIKQHPLIAAREILKPISAITDIIPIIEKHHENWNGSGYPSQLSGDDIPLEAQIILIIDVYYALLENRPYRDAKTKAEAIKQIEQEINVKWSERLASEFISIIRLED